MKTTTKTKSPPRISKQEEQEPKKTSYIIYSKEAPKQFNGIIGAIDLHCCHLLLSGGKSIIEEKVPNNKEPLSWYIEMLEQQDIYIRKSFIDKKGYTLCCQGKATSDTCYGNILCSLSESVRNIPTCSKWVEAYYKERGIGRCPASMPNYFENGKKFECE
jgi:hypothetical protein